MRRRRRRRRNEIVCWGEFDKFGKFREDDRGLGRRRRRNRKKHRRRRTR